MRVALFVTCLVDQLWPSVGASAVAVLRRIGCEVTFDERQTCCGQPAFNSGYRGHARDAARRMLDLYDGDGCDAVVLPSGSCTAMLHHYESLFADEPATLVRAQALAARAHELTDFLVNVAKVDDVGARFEGRVTWPDACHALRDLGLREEPRRLLRNVGGLELVELESASSCCGFGGTFSVKYPEISVAIVDEKLASIERARVDAVVSADASCLMQIGGRLARTGSTTRVLHIAELLAPAEGRRS
jgi:L-lactate dehydrogenase complex protein LldE